MMSTEQFKMVPANGSGSDKKSIDDSYPRATYEELIRNSDLFWDTLRHFLRHSDRTLEIPMVGGNTLDLHQLFMEVTSRGGLEKVTKDRKCKEVIGAFNFKTRVTNAAFVLRKYYLKMLFEFEHVYYFQDPISLFWAKEEAFKRLVQKSAVCDKVSEAQELQPGFTVSGIIDGKFESGYLVTVKMGSKVLKGVLYHTPETCVETRRRRRKKKSKSSKVDSQRPKSHRSGYNFFFSEQYSRLKAQFAGQQKSLIKEIGNMWTNLSQSHRQVYQEKGAEDVERYNKELSQYRSSMASCAAVTATDAASSATQTSL